MYNTEYVPVTIRSVWHSTFCCKDVMIVTFNLVHYWLLTSNYGWHQFGILLMSSFRDFDLVVIHGQFYLPPPPKKSIVCIVHSGGMSISMIIHSGKDPLKIVQSCSIFSLDNKKNLRSSFDKWGVFFGGNHYFFRFHEQQQTCLLGCPSKLALASNPLVSRASSGYMHFQMFVSFCLRSVWK